LFGIVPQVLLNILKHFVDERKLYHLFEFIVSKPTPVYNLHFLFQLVSRAAATELFIRRGNGGAPQ